MKTVYVAHPIDGDVENNLKDLARIFRILNLDYPDIAFSAPYYADIIALDDATLAERNKGIRNNIELINRRAFDEIWLTGSRITPGMSKEISIFVFAGLPVIDLIGKI